jgi:membrane protein
LLPGAVAMTTGLLVLRVAAALFVSSAISYNFQHYGPLGIVFMLLTWLVAFSVVMLGGPVLGAALHERRMQSESAARVTTAPPTEHDAGQAHEVRTARAETTEGWDSIGPPRR